MFQVPVNDLPCVGQISNYLHRNEDLFFDVDGTDHLVQKPPGVRQELTHLKVRLQLVELLDLKTKPKTAHSKICIHSFYFLNV